MRQNTGTNNRDLKLKNKALILKLIALHPGLSRIELASMTQLSKVAIGNLVSELINDGLLIEAPSSAEHSGHCGRRPIVLQLSPHAPCICGMLIKRGYGQVILADLGGAVLASSDFEFHEGITAEALIQQLLHAFRLLSNQTSRPILAIGIASVGPVNAQTGYILNPPFFFGLQNIPIVDLIAQETQLPAFLINDVNAGALAEKLYGNAAQIQNFLYVHIMNGIGAGMILDNKLYSGDTGQSGEIGHNSINFSGPKCACGNTGCLELYANLSRMQEKIDDLRTFFPQSALASTPTPTWAQIVQAGDSRDPLAVCVLDEFCQYIAYALINTLNLLDLFYIFIGYSSPSNGTIIEELLHQHISSSVIYSNYEKTTILKSKFNGDAPLIGSIAFIADKIFSLELGYVSTDQVSSDGSVTE